MFARKSRVSAAFYAFFRIAALCVMSICIRCKSERIRRRLAIIAIVKLNLPLEIRLLATETLLCSAEFYRTSSNYQL